MVGDTVLSTQQHVCELLSFCVQKHSYRIKYFILRNNVLAKVLRLARHRDKCLVLASLRFFRTCIARARCERRREELEQDRAELYGHRR